MIDMSIMNSFVIYKHNNNLIDMFDPKKKRDSFYKFKVLLADRLLGCTTNSKNNKHKNPHFVIKSEKSLKCKYCKQVKKKRRETNLKCNICEIPLCIDCFPEYHNY